MWLQYRRCRVPSTPIPEVDGVASSREFPHVASQPGHTPLRLCQLTRACHRNPIRGREIQTVLVVLDQKGGEEDKSNINPRQI